MVTLSILEANLGDHREYFEHLMRLWVCEKPLRCLGGHLEHLRVDLQRPRGDLEHLEGPLSVLKGHLESLRGHCYAYGCLNFPMVGDQSSHRLTGILVGFLKLIQMLEIALGWMVGKTPSK